ncbi:hypothetical protein GDO81_000043 [Engystomops pustulosus]|uniref:Ig-like domain-containing protein n=1 Tax=Engystomops pustulosus TaxID=76066 RepID=A0AAV7D2E9_ENGPU|nr:hypothetical protein GDO81_000043 [Engystomops pustulosus]
MTQTPGHISVSPGDTVTISCKASAGIFHSTWKYDALAWLQQKPGQPIKRSCIKSVNDHQEFQKISRIGSGTDFTLTIKGCREEDGAEYYCAQYGSIPSHSDTEPYNHLLLSLPCKYA